MQKKDSLSLFLFFSSKIKIPSSDLNLWGLITTGVSYQISCSPDIYIKIHDSGKNYSDEVARK